MDYKIIKFDKIQIVPEWRNRYGSQIREYAKNGKKFHYLFARHGTFLIDDEAARRCDVCGKLTNLIYTRNCKRVCSDKCVLKEENYSEIVFTWIIIGVYALTSLIFEFIYLKEDMMKQAKRESINLALVQHNDKVDFVLCTSLAPFQEQDFIRVLSVLVANAMAA